MTDREQLGQPRPDPKVAPETLELRARPQPVTRINRRVVIGAVAVLLCFISDPVGLELVGRIGSENVCWEMDYPHSDSSWPTGPEDLHRDATAAHLGTDDLDNITHRTAMRWFQYDPFEHVAREDATVGALRRRAGDHDISVRSMGRGRVETEALDLGEMSKLATGR